MPAIAFTVYVDPSATGLQAFIRRPRDAATVVRTIIVQNDVKTHLGYYSVHPSINSPSMIVRLTFEHDSVVPDIQLKNSGTHAKFLYSVTDGPTPVDDPLAPHRRGAFCRVFTTVGGRVSLFAAADFGEIDQFKLDYGLVVKEEKKDAAVDTKKRKLPHHDAAAQQQQPKTSLSDIMRAAGSNGTANTWEALSASLKHVVAAHGTLESCLTLKFQDLAENKRVALVKKECDDKVAELSKACAARLAESDSRLRASLAESEALRNELRAVSSRLEYRERENGALRREIDDFRRGVHPFFNGRY